MSRAFPHVTQAQLNRINAELISEGCAYNPVDTGATNNVGEVYAANETRFVEANFSEPLTAYAVGWRDPLNIQDTLAALCPDVPVSRRFEFAKGTNSDWFLSETVDDIRAIGSAFKRVEFTTSKVQEKCYNKGLTVRVDLDNVEGQPLWKESYTSRLLQRLYRNELRRATALIDAASTNLAVTWNGGASQDPDADVLNSLILGNDSVGIPLNRVLYGHGSWTKRQITLRAQNTPAGYTSATLTPEGLSGLLQVDQVAISKERYATSLTAKSKVVGDFVYLYYATMGMNTEDPSNMKRFVANTNNGGGLVKVFEQQISAHLYDITVELYSNIVVTSTLGIRKLTVS